MLEEAVEEIFEDVEFLSDDEVLFLLNKKPETCIKINTKIV